MHWMFSGSEGAEPAPNKPDEFDTYIRAEVAKFRKIVQDAGIKPE